MGVNPITENTLLTCSFGTVPATQQVLSQPLVKMCGMKAGTIMDNRPLMFGMCTSPMHPVVMATGSPGPCLAAAQVVAPWASSSTVRICGIPAIKKDCQLMCNFGGVIKPSVTPAVLVNIG